MTLRLEDGGFDFLNFYSQDEGEHFPTAGHQRRASAQFPHPKRVLHVEKF